MLAQRFGRHDVGNDGRRGGMKDALKDADDDERQGGRNHAFGQVKQQKARADAGGRNQQNRPPADPVGDAADERRCQQFAAGIATEQ